MPATRVAVARRWQRPSPGWQGGAIMGGAGASRRLKPQACQGRRQAPAQSKWSTVSGSGPSPIASRVAWAWACSQSQKARISGRWALRGATISQ